MTAGTELRWDPRLHYKAFVDCGRGRGTLVSSRIVDDVAVYRFAGVSFVTDSQGLVCDVEATLEAKRPSLTLPSDATAHERILETCISAEHDAPCVGAPQGWLIIRFASSEPQSRWQRVGDSDVYVEITGTKELLAVAAVATDDPDGTAESRFLDDVSPEPVDASGRRFARR